MPNFRPLAPLVWEENAVTDSKENGKNVLTMIHNKNFNFSLALLRRGN